MSRLEKSWREYWDAFVSWQNIQEVWFASRISDSQIEAIRSAKTKADQLLFEYFEAFDEDQRERFPGYCRI